MQKGKASQTAQYMAFFRALETQQPAPRRLFDDPYAFALLSGPLRFFAHMARIPVAGKLVHALLDLGWPYTRSSGVVRTRVIDDLVSEAVRGEKRQLVLLGAGFDSRGYRLEEAAGITVFEVDHPATQQVKKERISACLGRLPESIHYVPVDFEQDNLETKLIESGFDPSIPTVVVWEGVISYLTESALQATFAILSRMLAPSSVLIVTYMHKAALDGSGTFPGARRWRSWVSFSGEPFISGLDPDSLAGMLKAYGFKLQSDESTATIARRYCSPLGRS